MLNNVNRPKLFTLIMTGILSVGILLYFGLLYPHHLHFQEQYQLFLFDSDYFWEVISIPGGMADWAGRFLTQFFISAWAGATIITLLLAAIALLTFRLTKEGWLKGVGLFPIFILWTYLCDENALLGAIIALLFALLADWSSSVIRNSIVRHTLMVSAAPILYWALGPLVIVSYTIGLIKEIRERRQTDAIIQSIALFLVLLMPYLAHYLVTLPLDRLYLSPHYYRFPHEIPQALWIGALSIVAAVLLPQLKEKRGWTLAVWIVSLGAGGTAVSRVYDADKEETMGYDFMVRFQLWNRVIDTAQKHSPEEGISLTALNLAFGMKGQLSEHMFEYHQMGLEGLLPDFEGDAVSPLITSEVYYQLGMINTAQRFVFEAQEAISDYQKSGRCYKRLAETALISGQYDVARKYLTALGKTWFYGDWAQETLTLLDNEERIRSHKEYGRLRQMMPAQDYIYNEKHLPQMLGNLFVTHQDNTLAYEYLQATLLLQKDVDSFVQCLEMGSNLYRRMPTMYQQAFMVWWSRDHSGNEPVPDVISLAIKKRIQQFYTMFMKKPVDQTAIREQFGKTYWYYYFQ